MQAHWVLKPRKELQQWEEAGMVRHEPEIRKKNNI
jgi:hypothetical protein